MASPVSALNDNFLYNSMLARALVQLLSVDERNNVKLWLNALNEMTEDPRLLSIRNDYMWFLLLVLQSNKITSPFNKPPPREIVPLEDILSPQVYEELLTKTDKETKESILENLDESRHPGTTKVHDRRCPPCQFLDNQPTPKEGIICYLAAFSDHDS